MIDGLRHSPEFNGLTARVLRRHDGRAVVRLQNRRRLDIGATFLHAPRADATADRDLSGAASFREAPADASQTHVDAARPHTCLHARLHACLHTSLHGESRT